MAIPAPTINIAAPKANIGPTPALAAAEAADAANSVAQDASDAVAALAESVNLLITEIQAQIKSLAVIVARLAKK